DTTHGKVKLTSHDGSTGTFYEGVFKMLGGLDGKTKLVVIVLSGKFTGCPKPGSRTTAGRDKAKPKGPHSSVRHVWGNAHGHFRTKGRYAAATVRGTLWKTDDRCDGTLVLVHRGLVDVLDLVLKTHHFVPKGKSYFAHPK